MKKTVALLLLVTAGIMLNPSPASAKKRSCEASYRTHFPINSKVYGGISYGSVNLGEVRGIPRRKIDKCMSRAIDHTQKESFRNAILSRMSRSERRNVCNGNKIPIYIRAYVQGPSSWNDASSSNNYKYSRVYSSLGIGC